MNLALGSHPNGWVCIHEEPTFCKSCRGVLTVQDVHSHKLAHSPTHVLQASCAHQDARFFTQQNTRFTIHTHKHTWLLHSTHKTAPTNTRLHTYKHTRLDTHSAIHSPTHKALHSPTHMTPQSPTHEALRMSTHLRTTSP